MLPLPAILTVCCLWAGADAAGAGPASAPAAPGVLGPLSAGRRAHVEALIRQMGDDSYRRRQSAYRRLGEMGPTILPVLRKFRRHADAEIAARVESLIKLVGWTTRGALVVRMQPGTQAVTLGLRRGDVVVRIDRDDITGSTHLIGYDHMRERTATVWREGGIITKKLAPGRIGIYVRDWDHDAGGDAHARGLAAAVAGRHDQAYRLLRQAGKHWADDPWTKYILVGLAEYNLDHKRAMELYRELRGPAHRSLLKELGLLPGAAVDEDLRGLPFTSAHSAWAMEALGRPRAEPGRLEAEPWLVDYLLDQGRNRPLAAQVAAQLEGETVSDPVRHCCAALRIARGAGDWNAAWRQYGWVAGLDPPSHHEGLAAAIYSGRVDAAVQAGAGLVQTYPDGKLNSGAAAPGLAAVVAALAAGREDLAGNLLARVARFDPVVRKFLVAEDVHYLFTHGCASRRMTSWLASMAADGPPQPALQYVYLDTLRFAPSTTLAEWRREFAAHGAGAGKWQPKYNHWLDAETLLRFGRYAEARRAVRKFFPKYSGLAAFHRAADFLEAHAPRLERDWADLKGVTQMYPGRAKGSHWAVRYDGRTFHLDPAGKLAEPAGLAPGEIHRSICGDAVLVHPTGTIYCRRSQIYLLDEKARRWVRTFASPCRVPAYTGKVNDATGPVVLKHVVEHFPAAGPGREMKFREKAPGDWRLYHFNGDLVIAVQLGTNKVIDLGREIARLAGKPRRVAVYRVHVKTPAPLVPTDAGLWTMDPAGKLSRVTLDPARPDVIVSVLPWPKRAGKVHVGVAPQHGGRIYELDVKTRKVALTGGYCGVGPADSYHWFMHDRRQKRIVPAEYGIQALYEKRLARMK